MKDYSGMAFNLGMIIGTVVTHITVYTADSDAKSYVARYNAGVHVCQPHEGLDSLDRGNTYKCKNGTYIDLTQEQVDAIHNKTW